MIGGAAQVAGAGIGAEGLGAGMTGIRRLQKGHLQDFHLGGKKAFRNEKQVDELPLAIVFDGAFPLPLKRFRQIHQGRAQPLIQRVIRRIVEIAHSHQVLPSCCRRRSTAIFRLGPEADTPPYLEG